VAQEGEKGGVGTHWFKKRWSDGIPVPWLVSPFANQKGNVAGYAGSTSSHLFDSGTVPIVIEAFHRLFVLKIIRIEVINLNSRRRP
jgi:hypothetical protein